MPLYRIPLCVIEFTSFPDVIHQQVTSLLWFGQWPEPHFHCAESLLVNSCDIYFLLVALDVLFLVVRSFQFGKPRKRDIFIYKSGWHRSGQTSSQTRFILSFFLQLYQPYLFVVYSGSGDFLSSGWSGVQNHYDTDHPSCSKYD